MFGLSTIKLYVMAGALLAAVLGSAVVTHKVDNSRYEALQIKIEKAHEKALDDAIALQQKEDQINVEQAQAYAAEQQRLATSAAQQLKEVEAHVKANGSHCVTWGLVRVLDSAATRRAVAEMPAPAGKSDDACAPTDAIALARNVVGNYYTAHANADQLNALIADVRALHNAK